jgi:hypothetical protein
MPEAACLWACGLQFWCAAGVQIPGGAVRAAFSLDTIMYGGLTVILKEHDNATYVAGNITLLRVSLNVTYTSIGPVDVEPIQGVANLFFAVCCL